MRLLISLEDGVDFGLVPSALGFHAIRHHVASLLADVYKESLPTIQKLLGHKRLTTTERYIQSLTNDVHQAAAKLELPKTQTPLIEKLP